MSAITTHRIGSMKEKVNINPTIVLSTQNKIFLSAADCVPESYSDGTIDVQTGSIHYVLDAVTVFPFEIPQALHGADMRIDYITVFPIKGNIGSYIREVRLAHYDMNPEPPHTIEDLVVDWADTSLEDDGSVKTYGSMARVGPINITLDTKNMYCFIGDFGDKYDNPFCNVTFYGFGIEYSLIGA